MARTTLAAVKKVVKFRSTAENVDAANHAIETANILVTRVCVPYGDGYDESDPDDAALCLKIETYLAAHFFNIYKPSRLREEVGSTGGRVSQTIESKVDLRLNVTRPGQMAILLDVNGGLAALEAGADPTSGAAGRIDMKWLGTELT